MDQFFKFNSFMELRAQAQKEYLEVNDRLMTEDEVIAFVEQARKEIREEKAISNPKYIGLCKLCGKSKATDTPLKTAGASYNGENSKSGNPQLSHGQQNDSKKQASVPQKKSKLGTYEKYKGQTKWKK